MARLAAAVHLTDPKTRRPVVLQPGEELAPHLAVLITNEAAWENGELPALPDQDPEPEPEPAPEPELEPATEPAAPAEEKPARKPASRKPAAN